MSDDVRPVRPGEELDVAALRHWLDEHHPELTGDITVAQYSKGHSNLTYLLTIGDVAAVLRRPPRGARVKSGHDMGREYRILSHLAPVWPKAPRPLAFCDDPEVLGAPFYLMEKVDGVILRADSEPPDAATMRRVCESFVGTFAEVHALDYEAAGLGDLGRPAGYVERQISGWTRRWRDAAIDPAPGIDATIRWLHDHLPPESGAALIHNDFKLDNLVLDPEDLTVVRAVLDWEMATLGDPLMDVGSSLAYWVEPSDPPMLAAVAGGPTAAPGGFTRADIVEAYERATGRTVPNPMFYYVYGLFKLAVIAQQIYYRYHHGLTTDERFASFGMAAAMLGDFAQEAIGRGTV